MCVICVQELASYLELQNPSNSEGRRDELEEEVKGWKEAIQVLKDQVESYDSELRGESCPKGLQSSVAKICIVASNSRSEVSRLKCDLNW